MLSRLADLITLASWRRARRADIDEWRAELLDAHGSHYAAAVLRGLAAQTRVYG